MGGRTKRAVPARLSQPKTGMVSGTKHVGDWSARALQRADFMKGCGDFQTTKPQTHGYVVMKLVEFPARRCTSSTVFVGKNRFGNWVVREQNGNFGGLFASRAQALKYALRENGQQPEAILEVSREIELVFSQVRTRRGI